MTLIKDKRIIKKYKEVRSVFKAKETLRINKAADTRAQRESFYRLFLNTRMTEEYIMKEAINRTIEQLEEGEEVLAISDTTEVNYTSKSGRIRDKTGLGIIGNNSDIGYFFHPTILVNPRKESVIGFGSGRIWSREENREKNSKRGSKKFEEKEAVRWLDEAKKTEKNLESKSLKITYVSDREGDIYNVLEAIEDSNQCYVIRSYHDRKIESFESKNISEELSKQETKYSFSKLIIGNKKRKTREALLNVSYTQMNTKRPQGKDAQSLKPLHKTNVIEIKEDISTVPEGESAIHWILLSNKKAENDEEVGQIIHIYTLRWLIEESFRIFKSTGLDVESIAMEHGEGIRKVGMLGFDIALEILQMRQAYKSADETPCTKIYNSNEIQILEKLNVKLEGKTLKQKNPFKFKSIAWTCWIVARLGGWHGYQTTTPGVITFLTGIRKLNIIFEFQLSDD